MKWIDCSRISLQKNNFLLSFEIYSNKDKFSKVNDRCLFVNNQWKKKEFNLNIRLIMNIIRIIFHTNKILKLWIEWNYLFQDFFSCDDVFMKKISNGRLLFRYVQEYLLRISMKEVERIWIEMKENCVDNMDNV